MGAISTLNRLISKPNVKFHSSPGGPSPGPLDITP
jgi:hypothetical protein